MEAKEREMAAWPWGETVPAQPKLVLRAGTKKQNTSKLVQTMTILCFCLEDVKYLKYNPTPVINRWKEDIEQQCTMASCIHLIKMKVVPKFLYCFQNIPTFHSKETIWNNWFIFRFVWNGQHLRVNRHFLESEGGMSNEYTRSLVMFKNLSSVCMGILVNACQTGVQWNHITILFIC